MGSIRNTLVKKEYLKLIIILCIPMLYLCLISFYKGDISIGNFTLEKANIANYFTPAQEEPIAVDTIMEIEQADVVVVDTMAQRILFFGDSMLEGLSKRLRSYVAENNHDLQNVIWYSSSTKIWATHIDTLAHFIADYDPTYIFVCLGSNELFIRNLENHDAYVKTIISGIGDIPYIWIGPPNWKDDTGINDIIQKNVGDHRFFPSKRLTYQRGKDGAHPTYASAAIWMDSIAVWMNEEVRYRILMEPPQGDKKSNAKTIVLSPLR